MPLKQFLQEFAEATEELKEEKRRIEKQRQIMEAKMKSGRRL